jgi:hypothetical protein
MEPRAWCILGKSSASEQCPQWLKVSFREKKNSREAYTGIQSPSPRGSPLGLGPGWPCLHQPLPLSSAPCCCKAVLARTNKGLSPLPPSDWTGLYVLLSLSLRRPFQVAGHLLFPGSCDSPLWFTQMSGSPQDAKLQYKPHPLIHPHVLSVDHTSDNPRKF